MLDPLIGLFRYILIILLSKMHVSFLSFLFCLGGGGKPPEFDHVFSIKFKDLLV